MITDAPRIPGTDARPPPLSYSRYASRHDALPTRHRRGDSPLRRTDRLRPRRRAGAGAAQSLQARADPQAGRVAAAAPLGRMGHCAIVGRDGRVGQRVALLDRVSITPAPKRVLSPGQGVDRPTVGRGSRPGIPLGATPTTEGVRESSLACSKKGAKVQITGFKYVGALRGWAAARRPRCESRISAQRVLLILS